MTKVVQTLALAVVGLVAIAAVGPALARLVSALVPLVLVVGVVASVLRTVAGKWAVAWARRRRVGASRCRFEIRYNAPTCEQETASPKR